MSTTWDVIPANALAFSKRWEGAGYANQDAIAQVDVNIKAAEKMAKLHDALKEHGYEGHDLAVYLVRLLFCLFAEDTGIFPDEAFLDYVENSKKDGSDLSARMMRLFEILNTSYENRAKLSLLPDELKTFRHISGNLFELRLPSADFNHKMRQTLLDCCLFGWGKISPAIFGAMFQGVMDKDERRELGAHYTSEENILKLIKPLFLDGLREEFEKIATKSTKTLTEFHRKIASLKFLDPACGCGNFLMITYRELRLLELEVLKSIHKQQRGLDISLLVNVNVGQFYGIEIEDFSCQIAQVGMWLVDHQMNLLVSEAFGKYSERLPLTQSATIVRGNALRLDWKSIVPKKELSFILGNPPFVGYSYQDKEQKANLLSACTDGAGQPLKNAGKLDYVAGWFFKAAQTLRNTPIRAAFVSTNSITQGEQAGLLWKPLFAQNIEIDFAVRTFKWHNEAKNKAAVHCVIIGFLCRNEYRPPAVGDAAHGVPKAAPVPKTDPDCIRPNTGGNKTLFTGEEKTPAQNINPYLIDAPNIVIESRQKPICDVPEMVYGNKPADGGFLFLSPDEATEIINNEPFAKNYIRQIVGADEYINNLKRYCLWLVSINPADLRKMPRIMARVESVKKFRLSSTKEATRKDAATPTLFQEIRQPETNYILIPRVSSEKRNYVPIGFMPHEVIASDASQIIPSATLYHFAILTSNVHNAWMRAVCGRLEMRYRYSKDIVYNNFIWPVSTEAQKEEIEKLAQKILTARDQFPESTLA
ncbi:MAG: hypothetical protein LBG78_10055, partial [Azoarcus sp.]|nr:hypothetical protein [Azoarcus sp.]